MDAERPRRAARRRVLAAGLVAGLAVGAWTGAALFTRAVPETDGPLPLILHAGPALVEPGRPVELTAATYCKDPSASTCRIVDARALVRPVGATGWTAIEAERVGGAYAFRIDPAHVPNDGFAYWLRFTTGSGQEVAYPPGGEDAPIRVVTLVGLPVEGVVAFSWDRRARAVDTLLRLRPGVTDDRVGFTGAEGDGGLFGPSSFDVLPDGGIVVADWVHERLQRFDDAGRLVSLAPLPVRRPVDVAVAAQGYALTTLGVAATAYEVDGTGRVLGRYPVGYGVASRVALSGGPRVRVGSGQWIAVRGAVGRPLAPSAQSRGQVATVPLPDGAVGLSQDVGRRLAVVWTRPDGSRSGAVVGLPPGVRPGADYFVRPLPDGGALAARGVWDATHFGVLVLRFDAAGAVVASRVLPEPTPRMAAPYSTIRFLAPGAVAMAVDDGRGIRIDRFTVR